MTLASSEIRVGANGRLLVAPFSEGMTLPDDINDIDPDEPAFSGFSDVGFLDEDGGKFTYNATREAKRAWQQFFPVRYVTTQVEAMLAGNLLQVNEDNLPLVFGGGEVTDTANGIRFDPPAPEIIDERAALFFWKDGDFRGLIVLERCLVTSQAELSFKRTELLNMPVTLGVMGVDDDSQPWSYFDNRGDAGS